MYKTSGWVLVLALVGTVMVLAAPQPAEAASTNIVISDVVVHDYDCTTGHVFADFVASIEVPAGETAILWASVTAPGATTPADHRIYGLDGPAVDSGPWYVLWSVGGPLAPHTLIKARLYDANSSAGAFFTVDCTTGAVEIDNGGRNSKDNKDEEKEVPYTGIFLLTEDVTAPYFGVPNADGELPCGVFDVNGWGNKYVGMANFPACTAPVEVLCLNGDREWTADNVSGVIHHGDYEVDFTSAQDGVCAFFSAE